MYRGFIAFCTVRTDRSSQIPTTPSRFTIAKPRSVSFLEIKLYLRRWYVSRVQSLLSAHHREKSGTSKNYVDFLFSVLIFGNAWPRESVLNVGFRWLMKTRDYCDHGNDDCLDNYGFHAPIDGNRFGLRRMDDKVKDGLVLSVIWHWRDT